MISVYRVFFKDPFKVYLFKDFNNVEFRTLLQNANRGLSILGLIPIPPLHTLKLGPVNQVIN